MVVGGASRTMACIDVATASLLLNPIQSRIVSPFQDQATSLSWERGFFHILLEVTSYPLSISKFPFSMVRENGIVGIFWR